MDTRRAFLRSIGLLPLAVLSAMAALAQSCGSGGGSASNPVSCNGVAPDSMDLHTHPVCLPQSILDTPQDITLTLGFGGVGHTHTIFLTAAQVADIASPIFNGNVTVTSSLTGHTHNVTFLA